MLTVSTVVSLVILAGGFELAARALFANPFGAEGEMAGMYQNSEESSSVRTVPGWSGDVTVEGRTVTVHLNGLGLRSPEIGPRRPGELRVLCLGDSFVFGYGVADDETFPEVLRGLLADRLGRPVVVGNAGVPGYGTVEQALCLQRLRDDFDPDVVVPTIYIGNDFVEDRDVSRFVEGGFAMKGEWADLLRTSRRARLMLHSRAWMHVEFHLIESGSPWALQLKPTSTAEMAFMGFPQRDGPRNQCKAGLFMDIIDPRHSWQPGGPPVVPRVLARTEASLRSIQATAGSAQVLVVILPSWWHLNEAERLEYMTSVGLDPAEYRLGLTQHRLETLCAELSVPVVDVTPFARRLEDPASLFLREDHHLNPEGHRFVAELLADRIAALIP